MIPPIKSTQLEALEALYVGADIGAEFAPTLVSSLRRLGLIDDDNNLTDLGIKLIENEIENQVNEIMRFPEDYPELDVHDE